MEVPNVHAKSRFLISRNTLDHFKREGLPEKLVQSMEPLMEQVYPDREAFLTALAELEVPPRAPPGDRFDPELFCNGPTHD